MSTAYDAFIAHLDPGLSTEAAVKTAWNAAIAAAKDVCLAHAIAVGDANPGRGHGTVSHLGIYGQTLVVGSKDRISKLAA